MDAFSSRRGLPYYFAAAKVVVIAVMIFDVATNGITKLHARTLFDIELQAHLNRLNKPAVKTIQSEDGDIVDCVDVNKQPAFDLPLLRNHTIQMRPSFVPKLEKNTTTARSVLQQTWQRSGSCPDGTVPIRRVEMNDLRRVASSLESFGRRDVNGATQDQAGVILEKGGPYYGAQAEINVWDIPVQPNEWSHSAIEISDKDKNYIEAGALVNPTIFGDGKVRLYTFWTGDGYGNTGCYNMLCSGFVQVSKQSALGAAIDPVSVYDGDQSGLKTAVYKDMATGNWWLACQDEVMGYWPGNLFAGGKFEQAWQVKWIGSVLNTWPGGRHTTTAMGSGRFPTEGYGKAAFFNGISVVEADNMFHPPSDSELYFTSDSCYNSQWEGNIPGSLFYFGGPGREDCKSKD